MKHSSIASTCAVSVLFALALAPTTHADPSSASPSPSPSVSTAASEATPSASPTASAHATPSEATPTTAAITAPPPAPFSPADVIRQHWQELGGENGVLGVATSSLVPLRDGAFIQFYRGGQIYWTPQYGAHASRDGIHEAYSAHKWENGPLGFPTSDEENQTIAGIRGAVQTYENGEIRWSSQGGSHPIWGKILERYKAAETEGRSLGWPLNDEMKDAANGGVFQTFQSATAYWHPGSDSYFVHDAIMGTYAYYNWERGELGYPLSDETATANGGVYQRFQGGTAYWSPRSGSHAVTSDLLAEYGNHGYERGHLGYPTSEAYWDGNRHKQNFEHGVLEKAHDFNVTWAGQPNNYFCGPTSGWMILNAIGAHYSAQGVPLSINAVASRDYMNTVGYGYTSFHDRRFEYGMLTPRFTLPRLIRCEIR